MNQSQTSNTDGKNIIVGPDYEQISKQHTNSAIIEHFIAFLFAKNTKINMQSISVLVRNFAIILVIKTLLEESKSYLDKFRFTNLDCIRYGYQYLKYSEMRYELSGISNKWTFDNKNISINTLTPFLESRSIYVSQPNTYYYPNGSFLVKVIIANNKIIFHVPNLVYMTKYMDDLLSRHQEILLGGKTTMSKVTLSSADVIQFSPLSLTYAFETDNYKNLYEALVSNFIMDSILRTQHTPLCINFDGEPGTGKTTFGSYIADKGIFDRIVLYNLVQGNNLDFKSMLLKLEQIIISQASKDKRPDDEQEIILLIFDEIDKWLDSYTCNKIDTFRNESRVKKEAISGPNSSPTVIESYQKLTPEEEEDKRKQIRIDFLDKLYNLCDGQTLKSGRKYVIIFNTNHFDNLFEGAGTKYDALQDRFQRYHFEKIGKEDIIKYIKGICLRLKSVSSDSLFSSDKKRVYGPHIQKVTNFDEKIYDQIPTDIKISYRSLSKILTNNCYDIKKSVSSLSGFDDQNSNQTDIII